MQASKIKESIETTLCQNGKCSYTRKAEGRAFLFVAMQPFLFMEPSQIKRPVIN